MACYWGYQTKCGFATWIIFAVLFTTGCIWMPKGASSMAWCAWCKNDAWSNATYPDPMWFAPKDEPDRYQGCEAMYASWNVHENVSAIKWDDRIDELYGFCINSGPLAEVVAGSVVLLASLLTLTYFMFCAKRPEPSGDVPVAAKV